MRTYKSDLGKRSPGGGRVCCREYVPIKKTHLVGWSRNLPWLVNSDRLYVAWAGGPVVEFRFLHTVLAGSISSGEDHGVPCWWDLIRSKQLFSAPYVACRCLPDFLVMVISNIIYQFLHSKITYIYIHIYMYELSFNVWSYINWVAPAVVVQPWATETVFSSLVGSRWGQGIARAFTGCMMKKKSTPVLSQKL